MKHETKTYKVVDYQDVQRLVEKTYKMPRGSFNLPYNETWENDSEHIIPVKPGKIEGLNLIELKAPRGCSIYILFQDMCNRGIIESGDYLIQVCW